MNRAATNGKAEKTNWHSSMITGSAWFILVFSIILSSLIAAEQIQRPQLSETEKDGLRKAKIIRVVLNTPSDLPFLEYTKKIFEYGGYKVEQSDSNPCDLIINISARTSAVSGKYEDGSTRNTGARISGWISITQGTWSHTRDFLYDTGPALFVDGIFGQDKNAPFLSAFRNGFVTELLVLLGDVKGPDSLMPIFKEKDPILHESALDAILRVDALKAISLCAEVIKDSDPDVRQRAAQLLIRERLNTQAREVLLAALRDPDTEIRRSAIMVFAEIPDPRAFELLLTCLKDEDWAVREHTAWALKHLKNPEAVEVLITALKDPEWDVRMAVAEALGEIVDSRAVNPLIAVLDDKDDRVRGYASAALKKIFLGDREKDIYWAGEQEVWSGRDASFLQNIPLQILIGMKDMTNPGELIKALEDSNIYVRAYAVKKLGEIGDVQAVEPLIGLLKDQDPFVAKKAVLSLRSFNDERITAALIAAFQDEKCIDIQDAIGASLGLKQNQQALDFLMAMLNHPNIFFHRPAAWGLENARDPRAVDTLINCLDEKHDIARGQIKRALKAITGQDLGENPQEWKKWWKENKAKFLSSNTLNKFS